MRGGRFHFDIVGHSKRWFTISGVLMLLSIVFLFGRELNLGLEFAGGTSYQVQAKSDLSVGELRDALSELELEPVVQQVGGDGFLVQAKHVSVARQAQAIDIISRAAGVERNEINVNDVGPKWGEQITAKAIRALLIFLAIVAVYIALRFEPKMAIGALVALLHDILLTAGIYSATGFLVTPATVIAFLTILGYSLYDTVVVFDRVKDEAATLSAAGRQTYSQMANGALNHVLVRSLNTSITSLLPVGSLLFVGSYLLGAETLSELALALFVGITAGTYSSVFVAIPFLAVWKEREPRWATLRARLAARSAEATGPRVGPTATRDESDEPVAAPVSSGPGGPARPGAHPGARPPRPPRNRRKRRR
jgi:preprotein translocase subunit SecF